MIDLVLWSLLAFAGAIIVLVFLCVLVAIFREYD